MKKLNERSAARPHRTVRVLQFGEGNFLRAFADWMIDIANEAGVIDTGIAIVKPRSGKSRVIDTLADQDFLYHVCLEGLCDGQVRKECRLITAIEDAFSPDDTERYTHHILSPDLRFIISNTTEAGIRYEPDCITNILPSSFPGKITNLLWRRFRHFNGDESKGLFIICCELIEDNGSMLKRLVLRHADEAGLGAEFRQWVDSACVFADTLVDRIVSGAPDNPTAAKASVGFDDNAIVAGELYHLWAIGGDGADRLRREFPLDRIGLNVLFMPSIKEFRDRKVRILNGAHTALAAIGLLSGKTTVLEAFSDTAIKRFIHSLTVREILPAIGDDQAELRKFADSILERFMNPFIRHQLTSIALNSLSKWETRIFPTLKDYYRRFGQHADLAIFSFAALMALYAPDSGFTPEDDSGRIASIRRRWNPADLHGTIQAIASGGDIFMTDMETAMPGFSRRAADMLADIRSLGMPAALKNLTARL